MNKNRIETLSDEAINKIAAGEVVESPACVVKELVDNACDAGAKRIEIVIEKGGLERIAVHDDGAGISKEEIPLALVRHATSKIKGIDDLAKLETMGFRGEALASISSISKLKLTTCDGAHSWQVKVHGSQLLGMQEVVRRQGTSIEVSHLFYNVPARKKFQKGTAALTASIIKMVSRLSLAMPHIQFKLTVDNKCVIEALQTDLKGRIIDVLGPSFARELKPVEHQASGIKISGFIGGTQDVRHSRLGQHLFLNGRPIISPDIACGVMDGYGTRLQTGKHPVFVLHLTLAPSQFDVNVHPQKKEVRFKDVSLVKEVVCSAISKALQVQVVSTPVTNVGPGVPVSIDVETPLLFREAYVEEKEKELLDEPEGLSHLPVIGIYSPHLLLDAKEGLCLVDLNAAHARITFDQMELHHEKEPLLVPVTFAYSKVETALLNLHLDTLNEIGIGIRSFGETSFIIDSLLPEIKLADVESLVSVLLSELSEQGNRKALDKIRQKKLALTAAMHARSESRVWNMAEAKHVLDMLDKSRDPCHCPLGKPTHVVLDRDALKNLFQRAPERAYSNT